MCIGVIIGTPDHGDDDAKEISATHPLYSFTERDCIGTQVVCSGGVPKIQYNTLQRQMYLPAYSPVDTSPPIRLIDQ